MTIALEQLQLIMPNAGDRAIEAHPSIRTSMEECEIYFGVRAAGYLATIAAESEELRYRAELWGPAQVPVQNTYATRMGNDRPEAIELARRAGQAPGYYFRGYGWIQTTGFDNQSLCAKHFGIPLESMVAWLRTIEGASKSSAFFWWKNGLNAVADTEDFDGIFSEFDKVQDIVNRGHHTSRIGDANHWQKRLGYYKRALEVLC